MLYYLEHYFDFKNAGSFLLVSFLGLAVILTIILITARVQAGAVHRRELRRCSPGELYYIRRRHFVFIESFYEMAFASTSVLFFVSLYYVIDERIPSVAYYWHEYQNVLLLLFILISVLATNCMDVGFLKLTHIKTEQKAAIRLLSSFYIVLILLYIRFIYQDKNYDTLILYFVTLAVGRFVYFDFTWKGVREELSNLMKNSPLLILMAAYSGGVCWYGFHTGFLLKSNGVIISTLIAHFFMDLSIFMLHHLGLLRFFIPSVSDQREKDGKAGV